MGIKAPCKDCDRRSVTCHAECDEYKAYKAEMQRIQDLKDAENLGKPQFCRRVQKQVWKYQKDRLTR